jgi:hypothetical protein
MAAAAAAAAAVTAVTAATAAAASPTRYERTLRCARDLSDFAGSTEPGTRARSASGPVSTGPCLAQAPGDGYWQRVRCLAAAAGYVSGVYDLDPQFQKLVAERIAAGNPEREDSPANLLKRLKQLEQENAALRQAKRSRPEDAAAELKEGHRAQAQVVRTTLSCAV